MPGSVQSVRKKPTQLDAGRAIGVMRTTIWLFGLAVAGCTGSIGDVTSITGGGPSSGTGSPTTTGGGPGSTTGGGMTGGGPLVESPSPRFIRQLTLSEYTRTVTDLLHVANPDTTVIPPDVPMKGFTTNVAASFVSAIHFDAYFTLGMSLADRAVNES